MEATLAVTGFAFLRIGVPVVITLIIGSLLQRRQNRHI
jgi:hypothetical protein